MEFTPEAIVKTGCSLWSIKYIALCQFCTEQTTEYLNLLLTSNSYSKIGDFNPNKF